MEKCFRQREQTVTKGGVCLECLGQGGGQQAWSRVEEAGGSRRQGQRVWVGLDHGKP